jgi:hypothetical protein
MRDGSHKTRSTKELAKNDAREGAFFGFAASLGAPFLGKATRGVAFVEYVILLCLVVVGGSTALYSLGLPLVRMARFSQFVLGLPIP